MTLDWGSWCFLFPVRSNAEFLLALSTYCTISEKGENATERAVLKPIIPLKQIDYGGIWGSFYNTPRAIFYLLKGDYRVK